MRISLLILTTLFTVPASAQEQGLVSRQPVKLWVLDVFGEVHTLPGPGIISLPGGVTMEMVLIPAGSFMMGSSDDLSWSWCYPCEQPLHTVNINYDFYMCETEITQEQWLAVMGSWPGYAPSSTYGVGDDYPAYYISWDDCQNFITALNQLGQGTFRLPSEAEWEYACRAGTTTRFYFGDSNCSPRGRDSCELDSYAWWDGNNGSEYGTKPVGQLIPNAFGLFDMHGSVVEWCEDDWHDGYTGAPTDGTPWVDAPRGALRMVRGGGWGSHALHCRSAVRDWYAPGLRDPRLGVRVVRTP